MKRQSDIVRKNYSQIVQIDPSAIGVPPSGEVFAGIYNNMNWVKLPDGTINYPGNEVITLSLLDVSGNQTLDVPEGYLIQTITAYQETATPTVKCGTAEDGFDLMFPEEITSGEHITATVNQEISETGTGTAYFNISGSGATANIYMTIIKNR